VHLAACGESPLLVSRVGDDEAGERALAELARRGVDRRGVQRDPRRPTGRVEVELSDGGPRFEFVPGSAWDAIDAAEALAALAGGAATIVYHGTLAAREAASRRALLAVRTAAAAPTFVDVNLRPPWTPAARALDLARGTAWLKVNREEMDELSPHRAESDDPAEAATRLLAATGAGRLLVTDGERGARLVGPRGELASVAAPRLDTRGDADPVGAGDAFAAAILLGILRRWPARLALERAAELAAAICTVRGALPADGAFYLPFRRAWGLAA
jgi:fructokinase